jgi:hypothetical protein
VMRSFIGGFAYSLEFLKEPLEVIDASAKVSRAIAEQLDPFVLKRPLAYEGPGNRLGRAPVVTSGRAMVCFCYRLGVRINVRAQRAGRVIRLGEKTPTNGVF